MLGAILNGTEIQNSSTDYVTSYQIPTAANNYTWYRKYKSGWVEQGGKTTGIDVTIVLPVVMSDANYIINTDVIGIIQWSAYGVHSISSVTTTGFRCYYGGDQTDPTGFYWEVKGMAA